MANVLGLPSRIVSGRGSVKELAGELKRAGAQGKVLIVCDPGVLKSNGLRAIAPALESAGLHTQVFSGFESHPQGRHAQEAGWAARSFGAEAVVGVGGGSALDVARGAALIANNDAALTGPSEIAPSGAVLPFVLVPTLPGSGSETAQSATYVIDGAKRTFSGQKLVPAATILDAELTAMTPPMFVAAGGLSILAAALEAYVAQGSDGFADSLALEALARVARSLKKAATNPRDLDAREDLLTASALVGIAAQKGQGAALAIAHAAGAIAGTPHGIAIGAAISAVLAFDKMAAEERLAQASVALGGPATAQGCIDAVDKLRGEAPLPKKLSQAGVQRGSVEKLVELVLADAAIGKSPRPVGEVDAERMIGEAL